MPVRTKNTKNIIFIISAVISAFAASFSANAQWNDVRNTHPAHNLVWESKLYRSVEFLSDSLCAGRATGTPGSAEAAFWAIRSFRKSGLLPFGGSYAKHIYAGSGIVGHNIMGMLPGSKKSPRDSYIIVGAHYDHLGVLDGRLYPGADENASGTVAVASLADMFAGMKILGRSYGENIIFVLFDGRQHDLAGSYGLWRMIENGELADPLTGRTICREDISLMVNIEQIGSCLSPLSSGCRDYMIMLGSHSLPSYDRSVLSSCNLFYEIGLELAYDYYGSRNFTDIFYRISDQKVFIENKVPTVVFTSGITMNTNRTYDSAHTLDMNVFRRRIMLIFHWLERMAG